MIASVFMDKGPLVDKYGRPVHKGDTIEIKTWMGYLTGKVEYITRFENEYKGGYSYVITINIGSRLVSFNYIIENVEVTS